MTQAADLEIERIAATAGDIAAINLESARQRSWNRFWRAPEQPGIAELIVEQEQLTAQFMGDLAAFDRLEMLVNELARAEPESGRTALIAAQVACSTHRFAEARESLARAVARGAPSDATDRLLLTIDQATGSESVRGACGAARTRRAARTLGGADSARCAARRSGRIRRGRSHLRRGAARRIRMYRRSLPRGCAFQLGVLWGESVPAPDAERAAKWYRAAIDYLPCYVKARVHLAEIYLDEGRTRDATALLAPALESGDPEVSWRLADIAQAAGDAGEAALQLAAARSGFEALLAKHPLAFADHGAEFYWAAVAIPRAPSSWPN